MSAPAWAAEAAEVASKAGWFETVVGPILTAIGVALATVIVRAINSWAAVRQEDLKQAKAHGRAYLQTRLEASLARIVSNIANKELAELKEKAQDGVVDKEDLKALKEKALTEVQDEFAQEGVNLVEEFSEKILESQLRSAVDARNNGSSF
jgi:hypothetical protein